MYSVCAQGTNGLDSFNKILYRLKRQKLDCMEITSGYLNLLIKSDLDDEDIPRFMLVLISDGKPSDCQPDHEVSQECIIARLLSKA